MSPQIILCQVTDILSIDGNASAIDVAKAQQKACERCLAEPEMPPQADLLPGFYVNMQATEQCLLRAVVRKYDIVKVNVATVYSRDFRLNGILDFRLQSQY